VPWPENPALSVLALGFGLTLWTPALGIGTGMVTLQPLDLLVLAGLPLIFRHHRVFERRLALLTLLLVSSFALSFLAGGSPVVLVYYLLFTLPFLLLVFLIGSFSRATDWFLRGFLLGGAASALLFGLQIWLGAEALDFRSNLQFRLPPQYGRGFALLPEVSTFASHVILLLALCFVFLLDEDNRGGTRQLSLGAILILLAVLMLTRSSALLLLAPLLIGFAVFATLRPSLNNLLFIILLAGLAAVILSYFLSAFYGARLETQSAGRSADMRLSSILAGLTPLIGGEPFGVGLGNNDLVRMRAYEVSRALGLGNARLPDGISSLFVARLFEEGWPAVLQLAVALGVMLRAALLRGLSQGEKLLLVLAAGSFLSGFLVTGYRGIYTSWLWLALAPALLARRQRGPHAA
jgi:hypothetical protein